MRIIADAIESLYPLPFHYVAKRWIQYPVSPDELISLGHSEVWMDGVLFWTNSYPPGAYAKTDTGVDFEVMW